MLQDDPGVGWKIGYQTIVWGTQLDDWTEAFRLLHSAGFQGVEIFQHPHYLPPIAELRQMLDDHGLELWGLTSGTVEERVKYLGNFRSPYLYIDHWDEDLCVKAIQSNFRLAVHPHMFMQFQQMEQAKKFLFKHRSLLWLPDTAHLWIAGEEPASWFPRPYQDRTVAVHFKDWTPIYGTWSHRYAHGFVGLGEGEVHPEVALETVKSIDWKKRPYLVAEQDTCAPGDVTSSVFAAARWFHKNGVLDEPPSVPLRMKPAEGRSLNADFHGLTDVLHSVNDPGADVYALTVRSLRLLSQAPLVAIWAYSQIDSLVSLLAFSTRDLDRETRDRVEAAFRQEADAKLEELLVQIPLERNVPTSFNFSLVDPGEPHDRPGLASCFADVSKALNCNFLLCLPVPNSHNPHHLRFLIEIVTDEPVEYDRQQSLMAWCRDAALILDAWLDERCLTSAAETNYRAAMAKDSKTLLDKLTTIVSGRIPCEGVSILKASAPGDLEFIASTGYRWLSDDPETHGYRKNDGSLTGGALRDRCPRLTRHPHRDRDFNPGKSEEIVERPDAHDMLFVPIFRDRIKPWGVLRCRNRRGPNTSFSDDDLAVVDSILQAAAPSLARLEDAETTRAAQMRVTHEIKKPLSAIRNALDVMQMELGGKTVFSQDFIGDSISWAELTSRALATRSYLVGGDAKLQDARPVLLLKDVVAPARRQIAALLRERGFSGQRITDSGFNRIPSLYVDKNYFQQIVFNLLDNAIKYAHSEPERFHVSIIGSAIYGGFQIVFEDNGLGVAEEWREAIFEEGVREPQSIDANIAGHGLGLWIVRNLVEAHGGKITLSNPRDPTRIAISLPQDLSQSPKDRKR